MTTSAGGVKSHRYLAVAYVCVFAGAWLGSMLWSWRRGEPFMPSSEYGAFALLFVLAQAIERLVEPIAASADGWMEKDKAIAHVAAAHKARKSEAAAPQAHLDRIRQNLALLTWGIASFIAITACGAFGVMLFRIIGGSGPQNVPDWADITITGLVVGAGTKPLHDLISYVQKAKDTRGIVAAAVETEAVV